MRVFWSASSRAKCRSGSSSESWSCSSEMSRSRSPVRTRGSRSPTRPIWRAIATAVRGWSPVTITTRMPALRQRATASATSSRGGSSRATSPASTRPASSASWGSPSATGRQATASTRRPRSPSSASASSRRRRPASSSGTTPSRSALRSQSGSSDSSAPLQWRTRPSPSRWTVVSRRRSESKGISSTRSAGTASGRARRASSTSATSVGSPSHSWASPRPRSCRFSHSRQASKKARCEAASAATSAPGRTSWSTPASQTSRAAIRLRVSVPVVSVQITLAAPSASTEGRWRTSALRRAIRCAAIASESVMVGSRPSGPLCRARSASCTASWCTCTRS